MSVIKSKRNLSKLEFSKHFQMFYHEFLDKCRTISKRKRYLVTKSLGGILTLVLDDVMCLTFMKYEKSKQESERSAVALRAIQNILSADQYLLSFFINGEFKKSQRDRWVDMLNTEIDVLCKTFNVNCEERLSYYDMESCFKFDTFKLAVELQKDVHSKATRLPNDLTDEYAMWFVRCIDKAVYHIYHANCIYPKSKKQLRTRTDHFFSARYYLESAQAPVVFFCNCIGYSEKTTNKLFNEINQCIKKVSSVINSDKKRFKFD